MFFAKEMNYLSTRMMVLSKAAALIDVLLTIPANALDAMDTPEIKENFANDFDDMGYEWTIPYLDKVCENEQESYDKGTNFYQTSVHLDVSQENPRFSPVENGLNTFVRIFFSLETTIFGPDGCYIKSTDTFFHHIGFVIRVDKNGATIENNCSSVTIGEGKYEGVVTDSQPEVDREQLKDFFVKTLEAVDSVNGDKKYTIDNNLKLPFTERDFHFEFDHGFLFDFDDSESDDN